MKLEGSAAAWRRATQAQALWNLGLFISAGSTQGQSLQAVGASQPGRGAGMKQSVAETELVYEQRLRQGPVHFSPALGHYASRFGT